MPFNFNALFTVFFFKIDTVLLWVSKMMLLIYNVAYNPRVNLYDNIHCSISGLSVMSKQFANYLRTWIRSNEKYYNGLYITIVEISLCYFTSLR